MQELMSIQKIFNETLFRVPDYQRGYSWETQQLEEFWVDIECMLNNSNHYTGMLSLKKVSSDEFLKDSSKWNDEKWLIDSGYTVYEIVDGQQRLTTIVILINKIIQYCEKHNIDTLNNFSLKDIKEKYLCKIKPNGTIKTYLFGYEVDNPSYKYFKKIILGDESVESNVEESFYTLNLSNADKFFGEKLMNLEFSKVEEIFRKVTLYLKFNIYNIQKENEFVAFETMNNRGKKLSYLELLKNRLIYLTTLLDIDEDDKNNLRKEINESWQNIYKHLGMNKNYPLDDDEFLQNHWMIYFGYNTRKSEGNETIPYYTFLLNKYFIQQNIDNTGIKELKYKVNANSISNYVTSLSKLVEYWYQMYFPINSDISDDNDELNKEIVKYLKRIKALDYANSRPLITVLLYKINEIGSEDVLECLKKIERFNFLHYKLNGYITTYNNSVFYNLATELYKGTKNVNDVLEIISNIDYLSFNKVIKGTSVYNKFDNYSKRDGFYSWPALKFLLYVYDFSLSNTISEQRLNIDEYFKKDKKDFYSIEHIYPQTPEDSYWIDKFKDYNDPQKKRLTSSLGNLLPLSKSINSKLQNRNFDSKKDDYKKGSSSEVLVSQKDDWTPEEILNRGLEIVSFMEKEWDFKFPNLAEKKKFLGLDFMIKEGDETVELTEPIDIEEQEKNEGNYSEEQYLKLISKTNTELIGKFNDINKYILNLDDNVKKVTRIYYLAYKIEKNFVEVLFHKKFITLRLRPVKYKDPLNLIRTYPDSYGWTNNKYIIIDSNTDIQYVYNILEQSYKNI